MTGGRACSDSPSDMNFHVSSAARICEEKSSRFQALRHRTRAAGPWDPASANPFAATQLAQGNNEHIDPQCRNTVVVLPPFKD